MRNFLLDKLGSQNEHGKTYSEIFHFDYVEDSVGADFYDDVHALIQQTNALLGVQDPDLLRDQKSFYRRVNPGGEKQIQNDMKLMDGLESNFYTLIITFSDIEVVLDNLSSGAYEFSSPVYLRVEAKRMLIIKHDVLLWYPANNTQKARRWVELKIFATNPNERVNETLKNI